ncbi:hypothetical protein BDB01DRAFT_789472 [Pilobolus umbonatus]|nr:hypothetical protein BDB01DRAFT_789472 [Pilobolus umbonatus]
MGTNDDHSNVFVSHNDPLDEMVTPAAECLIRLRELHLDEQIKKDEDHNEMSLPQESLHSFSFTSMDTAHKRNRTKYGTTGHYFPKTSCRSKTKSMGSLGMLNLPEIIPESRNDSDSSSSSTLHTPEEFYPDPSLPHLHHRLTQHNQAILTTHDDWRIILTNHIAQDVLVSHLHSSDDVLVGKSVIDLIQPSYQNRLLSIIHNRRNEPSQETEHGIVLVCGTVIPMIKLDGSKSSASLWLKERINETGSSVFIWIFEEVDETTVNLTVNAQGVIQDADENTYKLYDYSSKELKGTHLCRLIPDLDPAIHWMNAIDHHRFFGSRTKRGAHFPSIIKRYGNTIRITSMPVIAGLMTIHYSTGKIDGCNDAFARYLFGYSQEDLVMTKTIYDLLPQFRTLIDHLKRDELLQNGLIINNIICRKMLVSDPVHSAYPTRSLTHTPNNQPLPIVIAVHRDRTPFEVQLQLKWVDGSEDECALWISFERDVAFKRFGHTIVHLPEEKHSHHDFTYSAQAPNSTCIQDYELLDDLGQGAYGLVKLAVKKNDNKKTKVVIKYVIKSRILVDCWTRDRKLGTVPVEIHILHTLRKIPHKNLGAMLDYFEDADYYYIVMGLYGDGMDLFDYIELNDNLPEHEIRHKFKQIVEGVRHLHENNIVHRDIKDENVVLDNNGGLRLIDFGSAAYVKPGRKYETFVGTLDYAAPEILRGHTYSGCPQDVWALGILLYTLIYRENPFYDIDEIMGRELIAPFVLSPGKIERMSTILYCKFTLPFL